MRRRPRTLAFWRGRLPHWEVADGRYFITLHVRGAIPADGRDRLRRLAASLGAITDGHSPDWLNLQRSIFREMERWLDRSRWAPHLAHRHVAEMIVEAVKHRDATTDWRMLQYVVMPTHIHLFCEIGDRGLRRTMAEFKRWTGHRAATLLPEINASRFWQREWFDHWSRSDEEDDRIATYIQNNPVKAGLARCWEDWPYRSK